MGYVISNHQIPAKLRQRHNILLWTVIALFFVFGLFYTIYQVNEDLGVIFFIICVILMTFTVVLMCMALYKIRQTVNNQMSEIMNMSRLVTHALAFILWITSWVIFYAIELITSGSLFYINWMFICLVGTSSYFFLCRLLWHLGSKNSDQIDFKSNKVSITSADSVDFKVS